MRGWKKKGALLLTGYKQWRVLFGLFICPSVLAGYWTVMLCRISAQDFLTLFPGFGGSVCALSLFLGIWEQQYDITDSLSLCCCFWLYFQLFFFFFSFLHLVLQGATAEVEPFLSLPVQAVLQLSRDVGKREAVFHLLKIVYKFYALHYTKYSSYFCEGSLYTLLNLAENWKAGCLSRASIAVIKYAM